jgi:hypothetical protein
MSVNGYLTAIMDVFDTNIGFPVSILPRAASGLQIRDAVAILGVLEVKVY